MKTILLSLLLVSCTSTSKKASLDCEKFKKEVLTAAVYAGPSMKDHGQRFVRDEARAAQFIQKYDVKYLNFSGLAEARERAKIDCTQEAVCNSSFENFNFLRGLIHGIKNNGWSPETNAKGTEIVISYLRNVTTQYTFIDIAMAATLLDYLNAEGLVRGLERSETKNLKTEIEKVGSDMRTKLKTNTSVQCADQRARMLEEESKARELSARLAELVSKIK